MAEEESDAVQFAEALEIPAESELSDVARGYWLAWQVLSTDRQFGAMGGASRIPWSSIAAYAIDHLFDDDGLLARMLWAMDGIFLEWLTEKQKPTDGN